MASCSYDHNHFENPSALSISIWVICTTELMWLYALLHWKPFQINLKRVFAGCQIMEAWCDELVKK